MARLVTTTQGVGVVDDARVHLLDVPFADLGTALEAGRTLPELARAPVKTSVAFTEVTLRPPVVRPSKIWALGLAYRAHIEETGNKPDAEPYFFMKPPSALVAAGQAIRLPRLAPACVDYEGEVAVVIGRTATDVSAADAWGHVAGVTIMNDVSARDVQGGSHLAGARANTSMGKGFDTFAPLGPCIASLDELDNPDDIELRTWVNGEQRQHARTSDLIWPIPDLIAFLSARTTLLPGDVISTGTPSGVGMPAQRFLRPGDRVAISVTGVGELVNHVVDVGAR
jgi:2-keto-4-pentenoate hydratase/2-oxohepta-3-ene-1,7-dioic acid hydratase in catechol pathway